jgi:hypothetical protein
LRAAISIATAAGVWLLLGAPAAGYWQNGQRWSTGASVVMHLQQGSASGRLIDGSTDWNTVTEGALSAWSPFLNRVSFRIVRDSTAGQAIRNNTNNVIWGDDVYGDSFGDAVAVTRWLYRPSDNSIVEADVIFDRGRTWNSYRGNLRAATGGGTLYDLRRVALHEFGHVIGLGHPNEHGQSVPAIMNSRVSNTDALQSDDTDGARAIYGTPAAAAPRDRLVPGARLPPGQSITSPNSRYRLLFQTDGNLVLYDDVERSAPWSTGTAGINPAHVIMQTDGNLVVYDAAGRDHWASGSPGNLNAYLSVQNDGNVVIYRTDGESAWDRYRESPR